MAVFFATGSLCFLVGPFPGYAQLVGASADATTFFVGSILFTAGGGLQTWLSYGERHAPGAGRAAWRAATIQSAGTLFFNVTTFQALHTSISNADYDRLVWRPDAFGSICFLVSGAIAYARLAAARLAARARRRRMVAAGGQPAGLRLLRHLRRRRLRRALQGLDPRPGGRQLEHVPRSGVLPGLRHRRAAH